MQGHPLLTVIAMWWESHPAQQWVKPSDQTARLAPTSASRHCVHSFRDGIEKVRKGGDHLVASEDAPVRIRNYAHQNVSNHD